MDRKLEKTELAFITYEDLRRMLDAVEKLREYCENWKDEEVFYEGTYIHPQDVKRYDDVIDFAIRIADNTLSDIDALKHRIWSICDDLANGKLRFSDKVNNGDRSWPIYKWR